MLLTCNVKAIHHFVKKNILVKFLVTRKLQNDNGNDKKLNLAGLQHPGNFADWIKK